MKTLAKRAILFFLAAFLFFGVLALGFYFGKASVKPAVIFSVNNPEQGKPSSVDFSLFWQTWAALENKFVNKDKLDIQQMVYGAIAGMVKSLGDPYTVFFEPEESKRFSEDVKGSFEGVGMEIGLKKGQLQVIAPLEGTPAQKAGMRSGDKIGAINGTSTVDLTVEEAVNMIRGPKGTQVTLTILRDNWDVAKEIEIIRDRIQIPSLKLELKEEEQIAYIKIYQFSERASADFGKIAADVLKSQARSIIIDLRDNPGGYLEVAQDLASWFLESGQIVAIEDFGGKKEPNIYRAQGSSLLLSYPAVVLINQGSASASEILAGALKDNRNVKLIGEKSFGKGSVQELESLTNGSSLKVTIAKWLTPQSRSISEVGLEPDILVKRNDEDFQEGKDPQLDRAIEIAKEIR